MRDQISALQDGELEAGEAAPLLARLKGDPALRSAWDEYHRVGDALRGHYVADLKATFKARLDAEPTVLAPHRAAPRPQQHFGRWASAAAGIAAVAAVAWVAFLQPASAPAPQVAQAPVAVQPQAPAAALSDLAVGNYLLAHQRYSPSNALQGVAPYVRTVSAGPEPR